MNRKERATYELNGARGALGEKRPKLRVTTPGDSTKNFQIEATQQLIHRVDETCRIIGENCEIKSPLRTKYLTALIEAAWQSLLKNGNIRKIAFNYLRALETAKESNSTPIEKLRWISEHLDASGIEFPENGPTSMTPTLRLLLECAYDSIVLNKKKMVIEFDYTL